MDALTLTRELIRLNTALDGEAAAAALIARRLEASGTATTVLEWRSGRHQLIARHGGDLDGTNRPVILTGHLDTVAVDTGSWTADPWGADVTDGWVYGRGSSDMKAGVAALTVAFITHASRPHRCRGVHLLLTAAEETGCEGARQLADAMPADPWAVIVAEPTANRLVLGHKGALWLRLSAHGRAAHGSRPELGDNAALRLARAVQDVVAADIWPTHPQLGASTVNVGTFHAGQQVNLVPHHAEAGLDIRSVPGVQHAALARAVGTAAGAHVDVTPMLDLAPVLTDPAHPAAESMRAVLRELGLTDDPLPGATYFTDAAVLGGPALILGPGEPEQAHVTDERCRVENIYAACDVYTSLLDKACAQH
ncbi:M20 family metallopeptidase [Phytoactinopolyspora mesophila]|uniref:M20/M25/M40 family metallo-hydrolase n=1 Tax=Phytoactinopolyspora mesophila TaxID=2650750 RepID=A0A7K3M748_9ACTN|nr:M20 family metallopeptidase [Phytoactinopolyspora mesophila]NDL59094.1 M20/M25/M40 family metallo-hydrolase [Phytoactinopolyspora mesophila]